MSSSGTNYVLKEYKDAEQFNPYPIPSEIMPCYGYFVSFSEAALNHYLVTVLTNTSDT